MKLTPDIMGVEHLLTISRRYGLHFTQLPTRVMDNHYVSSQPLYRSQPFWDPRKATTQNTSAV